MDYIGKTVKSIRTMTAEEKEREGWEDEFRSSIVLEFDDGSTIYASRDEEGNGPGALFGTTAEGQTVYVMQPSVT